MLTVAAQHDEKFTGFTALPSDRSRDNVEGTGWLIATTVKQSKIPGGGYGRFSDVDVPKNTTVMAKKLVPMANVSSIHSIPNDVTILFKNEEEIEKFIYLYETEGQQNRQDTINCLSHFIFTLSNLDGVAFHWTSSSINHGDVSKGESNTSVVFREEDGMIVADTLTDVKAGDELLCDYRNFDPMKKFWVEFCEKSGEKDVLTILKQYIEF